MPTLTIRRKPARRARPTRTCRPGKVPAVDMILEGRALLADLGGLLGPSGLVARPAPALPAALRRAEGPATTDAPPALQLTSAEIYLSRDPSATTPGVVTGPSPLLPAPASTGLTPHRDARPVMAGATLDLGGRPARELAIADPTAGSVAVYRDSAVVFRVTGLDRPGSVKLDDINQDGIPDLIIADTGAGRVLVHTGRADGGFDPHPAGGGFVVGTDPVGLTVGDVSGDGRVDLLVANRGSDDVTVLFGVGDGSTWTLDRGGEIRAGVAPVRTVLVRPDEDAVAAYLLICNSGSDSVWVYRPAPGGLFDAEPARILGVGSLPFDLFAGRFGQREGAVDLVTLNAGTNDLTVIDGLFGDAPVRRDVGMGTSTLLAAVALTIDSSGASDLMVAAADGRVAQLRPAGGGYQLADVVPASTWGGISAIAGGASAGGGYDLFEASTLGNAVAVLHLERTPGAALGGAKSEAEPLAAELATTAAGDDGASVELIPGGGLLDLFGVLWGGSGRVTSPSGPSGRGATSGRASNPGPGAAVALDRSEEAISTASRSEDADELATGEAPPSWADFVLGIDDAFAAVRDELAAIPDDEALFVDATIPSTPAQNGEGTRLSRNGGGELAMPRRAACPGSNEANLAAPEGQTRAESRASLAGSADLATAAVGSAVAVRLIVNASPPRPPRVRTARRPGRPAPWPEVLPPTHPHA